MNPSSPPSLGPLNLWNAVTVYSSSGNRGKVTTTATKSIDVKLREFIIASLSLRICQNNLVSRYLSNNPYVVGVHADCSIYICIYVYTYSKPHQLK